MAQEHTLGIVEHFADLEDPRNGRRQDHLLLDIVTIAICAVICGADGWVAIEEFGKAKEQWLRTFLKLANGIPSHDTFGRVFARIDPDQFQASFLSWMQSVSQLLPAEVVAIDGQLRLFIHPAEDFIESHFHKLWIGEGDRGGELSP